jgi:hypothetical protein
MANGRWRSAVNGPDWTDVRVMMGCLAELHHSQCYLELAPDGSSAGAVLVVRALLVSNTPGSDLTAQELGVSKEWPDKEGSTVPELAYRLLYDLDRVALLKWWQQGEFQLP